MLENISDYDLIFAARQLQKLETEKKLLILHPLERNFSLYSKEFYG